MATFYLLPPRACLERAVSDLFGKFLPGLPLPADAWDAVASHVAAVAGWPDDVFLIPRDELPDGDPSTALADAFGAEPGDRVVDVGISRPARVWALEPAAMSGVCPRK
jgi:hypothetical protein